MGRCRFTAAALDESHGLVRGREYCSPQSCFSFAADYARKETTVGYLTPTKGTAKIFVPRRGTIKEVHVDEGASVREGQQLLTIETEQITADGVDVNATQLETLQLQKGLLATNIIAEEQRAGSEHDRLTALAGGLQSEITQLQARSSCRASASRSLRETPQPGQQLNSKGYMAAVDFRRRHVAVLEQRQLLSSVHQQLAAKQSQLSETRFSLSQLPTVMAQKVQALRNDLSTIEQRIAEIKGRSAYVIRAPTAGRVSTLQATVGQNADPQRLQLEIIPKDAVLQAELFLPARASRIRGAGPAIRIMYDAFPYQHFGTYRGRVVNVSQTILTSSDAAGPYQTHRTKLPRDGCARKARNRRVRQDNPAAARHASEGGYHTREALSDELAHEPVAYCPDVIVSLISFTGHERLPLVRQTEAAECGLACLAMIASYHGHRIDLNTLRRRYPVSLNGVTLRSLIQVASQLHLVGRPLRLELEHLGQLRLPAILHWDMSHFVVLKKVGRKGIVINDPATGEKALSSPRPRSISRGSRWSLFRRRVSYAQTNAPHFRSRSSGASSAEAAMPSFRSSSFRSSCKS
jgi:membrane fusion protein